MAAMDRGFSDRHDAWHGTFDERMVLACLNRLKPPVDLATHSMLRAAASRLADEDHSRRRGEQKKNCLRAVHFGSS